MPIGGENIGSAYVRIYGDGSSLPDDIRDSLDKSGPAISAAGRRAGEAYENAFEEHLSKSPTRKRLREAIAKAVAHGDVLNDEFLESRKWTEFRNSLQTRFGTEIGSLVARNLETAMIEGLSFEGLERRLDNLAGEVAKATGEIRDAEKREWSKMMDEAIKMNKDFDTERLEVWRKTLDEAYRMNKEYDAKVLKNRLDMDQEWQLHLAEGRRKEEQAQTRLVNFFRNAQQQVTTIYNAEIKKRMDLDREFEMTHQKWLQQEKDMLRAVQEELKLINREWGQYLQGSRDAMSYGDLRTRVDQLRQVMRANRIENSLWNEELRDTERQMARTIPVLSRFNRASERTADMVGTLTGRGSRNNFLNFIGSLSRNMTRLLTLPARMVEGFAAAAREGMAVFKMTGSLTQGLQTFFISITGGIAGVALFTASLVALLAVIPFIVSALSLLLGVVTALAASLTFALIGALAAVVGALAPLTVGIAATIIAFANLDKTSKKSVRGLVKELKEIGKVTRNGLLFDRGIAPTGEHSHRVRDFTEQMAALRKMVAETKPIFFDFGRVVADLLDIAIDRLGGVNGAWTKFIRAMNSDRDGNTLGWLADRFHELGTAGINTFGGLLGVFRAMMPLVREFTGWISDGAREFNKWANSEEGQQKLKKFFRDVGDSAKAVGGFLQELVGLIGDIFDVGRESGDNIFLDMENGLKRIRKYFEDNPDALKNWFADAEEFADNVGGLLKSVNKLFDAWDNSNSRKMVTNTIGTWILLIELLADTMVVLGGVASAAVAQIDNLILGLATFGGGLVGLFKEAIKGPAGDPFKGFLEGANGSRDAVQGWLDQFKEVPPTVDQFKADVDSMTTPLSRLGRTLLSIPPEVKTKILALGADATWRDVKRLANQYDLTPKQVRTVLMLTGVDPSKKQLREFMHQLKVTNKEKAEPKLGLDTSQFKVQLEGALKGSKNLDSEKPKPEADLDINPFTKTLGKVKTDLLAFGRRVDTSTIKVNNTPALQGIYAVQNALSGIRDKTVTVRIQQVSVGGKPTATGGLFTYPQTRLIGEDGPEAVVPLNRSLSQVDPAVRWLSAIAQGKLQPAEATKSGPKVDASGWQIITPTADPRAVATEVLNQLVAKTF